MSTNFLDKIDKVFKDQGLNPDKPWIDQKKFDWIWIKYLPDVPDRKKRLEELKEQGLMPKDEEIID